MIELSESSPFEACELPVAGHGYTISALPAQRMTSLSPWEGQRETLASVLGGFPGVGEVIQSGDLRMVWAGRDVVFAFGEVPPIDLQPYCAVTDQSDGWAGLLIAGTEAESLLARRLPFDLRKLPAPGAARSILGRVPVLVVRLELQRFELWSWRSLAGSLLDEVRG